MMLRLLSVAKFESVVRRGERISAKKIHENIFLAQDGQAPSHVYFWGWGGGGVRKSRRQAVMKKRPLKTVKENFHKDVKCDKILELPVIIVMFAFYTTVYVLVAYQVLYSIYTV